MTGNSKTILFLVAFITMVLGAFTFKVLKTSAEPEIQALVYPKPKQLPEFTMMAHTNTEFTERDLLGKWSVVFFGFTYCPDICPTTMTDLGEMAESLPEDVAKLTQFLFVSVDPERDTVEQLANYVPFFNQEFIGTVGTPEQLELFSKSLGAVYVKVPYGDSYQMQHTGRIFIINPAGQRFGIFAEDPVNPGVLNVPVMTSDLTQIVRDNS
ncbi:MAG: SCO family protein [Gammaproteobacteria bacterium]